MSSPAPSNISQNNTEMFEEQHREMQQQHEEEQQSLLWLQKAAEARHAERAAQKVRRGVEEEKRKKRTREYLQQLWDEVLEEEATLLEGAEGSQVMGSKHKKVASGDEEEQRPSKKARGKYRGDAAVKMGGSNPCERCVCAGQDCLVYPSR